MKRNENPFYESIPMLIDVDLNTVPDTTPKIPSAIYNFRIMEVSDKAPKPKPDGSTTPGINIVIKLEIVNNGEQDGRQMTHYIFIPADNKREDKYTQIKRVFLSAGIPISSGGMNTNDLVGKVITAEVRSGAYQDPATKVTRETVNISQIFIPADGVKANSPVDAPAEVDISGVLGGNPAPVAEAAPAASVSDILAGTKA